MGVIMNSGKFEAVRADTSNPRWDSFIRREKGLYARQGDIRSEFARDYGRILHCTAYRRLKHKTQVFFATRNDHVCTRIEHVNHVQSASYTIAKELGLNTELTNAIAIGHDLGHAPFGHEGETILANIAEEQLCERFWHERNGLNFVDKVETLPDPQGAEQNLNLTYAVRDGIICHCGEVDDAALVPREAMIDLGGIRKVSEYAPFTWEGCVVKIADKISFLGRDIEDAMRLRLLTLDDLPSREVAELVASARRIDPDLNLQNLNTTVLMHRFIINLCEESDPAVGLRLSQPYFQLMKQVKAFSNEHIYKNPALGYFKNYARLILISIFEELERHYHGKNTLDALQETGYSTLVETFSDWLVKLSDVDLDTKAKKRYLNDVVYKLDNREDYVRAIIDYISGMTDSYAIKIFGDLTAF